MPHDGYSSEGFTGSLDGDGYSIRNLFIDKEDESYVGLFSKIHRGKFTNLDLEGINVAGDLTGEEMKDAGNFTGWDFEHMWAMDDGEEAPDS